MALSDYEKQVLEEMEAQFGSQPASFDDHSRPNVNGEQQTGRLSPRRVAAGALMIIAGLLVLIAAVSLGYSVISLIVGVAGFLLMVGGAWYALTAKGSSSSSAPKRSSFMERQQEQWDRRSGDR